MTYDLTDASLWQPCPDDATMLELIPGVREKYKESCDTQLQSWLDGKPEHNTLFNECCPDFSCCHPSLMWSDAQRKTFFEATPEVRQHMLMFGLAGIAAQTDEGIYIAGLTSGEFNA